MSYRLAYQKGHDDYWNNVRHQENPFTESQDRDDWEEGFNQACLEHGYSIEDYYSE